MTINIKNNDPQLSDEYKEVIKDFSKYASTKLHISRDIKLFLLKKDHKVKGISTAGYDKITNDVNVRTGGRALVDICRSIAHEFGHARQKEIGQLEDDYIPNIGGPIEDDANAAAGRLVKMYVEDTGKRWIYKA